MKRLRNSSASGLTMIETLVSLVIFTIVTLGLVPLIATSLQGSTTSRSFTVGKNLTTEAMERARGLPFFESVKGLPSPPPPRDFLDIYYPNRVVGTPGGYSTTTNVFTTQCTSSSRSPATSSPAACPARIPAGYTVTFTAAFVRPVVASGVESYSTVAPSATYNSAAEGTETVPRELVRFTVRANWSINGNARSFTLTSLMGNRRSTPDKIKGSAAVDYAIQVISSYDAVTGDIDNLLATIGASRSQIESKAVAAADLSVNAGRMVLSREESATAPASTLVDVSGATADIHAAPNLFPAPAVGPVASRTVTSVAFLDQTTANDTGVQGAQVVNELPKSVGRFTVTDAGTDHNFWVMNQADPNELRLAGSAPFRIVSTRESSAGIPSVFGASSGEATDTAGNRRVIDSATTSVGKLSLFPVTFVPSSSDVDQPVLRLLNFTASVNCEATADSGSAVSTATWSGDLYYWNDPDNDFDGGGLDPAGSYVQVGAGTLTQANADAALAAVGNPLVYEEKPSDLTDSDLYLFDEPSLGRRGFLNTWSAGNVRTASSSKREANAEISGALNFETSFTDADHTVDPALNPTGMSISVGSLSCSSEDKRDLSV